ncbi:MAG: phytochelatin synthase family protein [Geminicoccaceae bacterium]
MRVPVQPRVLCRLALLASLLAPPMAAAALEPPLVYFDQPESAELFERAGIKGDYWTLARFFVSERYLTYCGIATSVAVLNSLGVASPISPLIYPYQVFTEDNIFTREVLEVKPVSAVEQAGLTLEELARLLEAHGVKVDFTYGPDATVDAFRDAARAALEADNQRLVVNYSRQAVGQKGDGHISPVAAYEEVSDRFLVLDVARYKYPPAWITATELHAAMQADDSASNKPRGFLVVTN